MKKKIIFLLTCLMPFLVSAENLDEYELKWTEELPNSGYTYNPYMEIDKEYMKLLLEMDEYSNQSQFIEQPNGYLIIDNNAAYTINSNYGIEKMLEYENMRNIEYNGYYYFISWEYRKNTVKVEKVNSKLEILSSISFTGNKLVDCFVENEKIIVVYKSETSDNQMLLNSVTLKADNLEKINTSKKIILNSVYKYNKKLYYDRNSTYFKLDNDYNIVSELSFKDGTQILLDRYSYGISKTNNNNEIEKTITLTPSNGYSARNKYVAISNDKLYIALVSNKYDSTNKIYNHQIEYFEYDKNLELKNTYVITETSTSYQLSGGQIYVNNNGVFTSYNNKYYKINSDFSFTESTSENMYSNFRGEGYDEPKASEDVEMLDALSWFTYDFVGDLEKQAEEDNYQENTNTYAYGTYSFDYYYDKEINEILLSITVIMEIDSNNYEKITETSYLLTLDSNNLEVKDLIVIEEHDLNDWSYTQKINNRIVVDDEYIILGLSFRDYTTVTFYDKETKEIIDEFINEEDGRIVLENIEFKNGHLMLIYTEEQQDPGGIKNIESDKINDTKHMSFPYHRGLNKIGINSVIKYYARPFNIETKTDGNGTVTAKQTADSGENVTFTIEPKEGFMLKEVKVTDANGNVITFTDYTFTMPSADVTIDVSFVEEVKNSETSDAIIYSAIAIIIGISFIIYNNKKKLNWLDK